MADSKHESAKTVRRSVTLSAELDRQVQALAKHRRHSDEEVLAALIAEGIESAKENEEGFFAVSEASEAAADAKGKKAAGEKAKGSIFGD